jgi:hypothetical protein
MLYRLQRIFEWVIFIILWVVLLTSSTPIYTSIYDRARAYTRSMEFDYISWTFNAAWIKFQQDSISSPHYMDRETRKQIVMEYLRVGNQIFQDEGKLNQMFADPSIEDKQAASASLRHELDNLYNQQSKLAPFAESILQEQVSSILAQQGLTAGGQPIPPVLYHMSPVPNALIVSPRDHIEQIANISLSPKMTVDQEAALENQVDKGLNVSSLVVPIGGIGSYPTMVMRTTDLSWLLETVSHEWTHNYLSLRPLGINYDTTPELRTMNETTASIVGKEIGTLVLKTYYPELADETSPDLSLVSFPGSRPNPNDLPRPVFDFRKEMRVTRVTVDNLLSEGKIDQAEAYMEQRRQVFWDHGYAIRKLNQAYFAFYGAYADVPGGAAGTDPVGPAVRTLRAQSKSLADFVNTISWMTSFQQLQNTVTQPTSAQAMP